MSIPDYWRSLPSSLFGSSTVASEQLLLKHYFVFQTGIQWFSVVLQIITSSSYHLAPQTSFLLSLGPLCALCTSLLLKSLLDCSLFMAFLVPSGSLVTCMALTLALSLSCGYLCHPLHWIFSSLKSGTMFYTALHPSSTVVTLGTQQITY